MPLSLIPYVVVGLMALAAVAGAGWKGYQLGADSKAAQISELQGAIALSRAAYEAADKRATEAAAQVRTVYRDRIRTIREAAPSPEIIERVRIETADCPTVPPSFVGLWNDSPADSSTPKNPPGTAYTWGDVAAATAAAKQAFELNRAKLEALQSLVREHGNNN